MDPINSLAQRANQSIGEELVRRKLTNEEMIEQAQPLLEKYLEEGEIKRACLLKILIWDLELIEEKNVLDYHIEEFHLGYCNTTNYKIDREALPDFKLNECWATMSIPVDFNSGVFFVATCNYLSSAVMEHWEMRLTPKIFWYLTDLTTLTRTLEDLEKEENKESEKEDEKEPVKKDEKKGKEKKAVKGKKEKKEKVKAKN